MTSTLTLNISCDLQNKEDFKMFKTIMKIRVKVLSTLNIQSEGTIYTKHSSEGTICTKLSSEGTIYTKHSE